MADRGDKAKVVGIEFPDMHDEARDGFDSGTSTPRIVDAATKKSRRMTVYPNINSTNKIEKPFSRSAAKRDSVMALGSIEHLQHYFTKAGLSAAKNPRAGKGPFVPALGPAVPSLAITPNIPTLVFDLPPSPVPPVPSSPGPAQVTVEPSPYIADPEALKPSVIHDLEAVETAWKLGAGSSGASNISLPHDLAPPTGAPLSSSFDVLHVLKITTRAIRSVRNYLLALPDDHPTLHFGANLIEAFKHHSISRPSFGSRRQVSGSGTPRPPNASPAPPSTAPTQTAAAIITPPDPSSVIRRSALDVLSVLRVLEERSRLPLSDEAYESNAARRLQTQSPVNFTLDKDGSAGGSVMSGEEGSDGAGSATLVSSPGFQPPRSPKPEIIPLKVQGREKAIEVWADQDEDEWEDFDEDAGEKQDPWDERLVLGGGWLYRSDIELESLERERSVVKRYLDVVDEVVFADAQPTTPGTRAWKRAKAGSPPRSRSKVRPSLGLTISDGSPRKGGASSTSRPLVSPMLLDAMSSVHRFTEEPSSIDSVLEEGEEDRDSPREIPDDALPSWAKRNQFASDSMLRLHAFIAAHLPPELISYLPSPSLPDNSDPFTSSHNASSQASSDFRERLLSGLSDGQLLCTAYNAAVRKSRNPWGYIHLENVHDLLGHTQEPEKEQSALEMDLGSLARASAKSKTSWTFRRTENLRYWAAALKLRYMIPFVTPRALDAAKRGITEQKSTSTLSRAFSDPLVTPPVVFEPKVIAAREAGWEDMFETVLFRWLDVVLAEKRTKA